MAGRGGKQNELPPISVYNNAPEHRAKLIDAAENEIKWNSVIINNKFIYIALFRKKFQTASQSHKNKISYQVIIK